MSATQLFAKIEALIPTLGGWTTIEKAHTYAGLILGLRPAISCELGAWNGRGALSMALAHKEIGFGIVYAVDAWSPEASAEGQTHEADRIHWANSDHEIIYQDFLKQLKALGVTNCVKVIRARTRDAEVPDGIGLLVIDSNHGREAISDAEKFGPKVIMGGVVYLDDLNWSGGYVLKAAERLKAQGFRELFGFETGMFYQRT